MNVTQVGSGRVPLTGTHGTQQTTPEPIAVVKSSRQARVAQTKVAGDHFGVSKGELLLTKDGVKLLLGKPSIKAKVKDQVVKKMHQMSDRLAPNSVGSHHKEAVRLAGAYDAAKKGGAPPEQLKEILDNLKHELQAHKTSGSVGKDVGKLVEFVDHELTQLNNQLEVRSQQGTAKKEGLEWEVGLAHRLADLGDGSVAGKLGQEIQSFDRSKMTHIDVPQEGEGSPSTVPDWAQNDFHFNALVDDHVRSTPEGGIQHTDQMLQDPGLTDLSRTFRGSSSLTHSIVSSNSALGSGDPEAVKTAAQNLGKRIGQDLSGLDPQKQMAFAISDGAKFKEELYGALKAQGNTQLPDDYATASDQVKAFLDEVFKTALEGLPNKQTAPDKLMIGGKEYTQSKELGEGAYGKVHLYEHTHEVTDPGTGEKRMVTEQLAVKSFYSANLKDAAEEIRAHQSAMGPDGHPNVVGMKGAIRCPDGSVLMAMEVAKTSGYTLINQLNEAVAKGQISQEAANVARITILKDMLKGLQHFQEARGMSHLDVKDPNFLVGLDGRTKLADFGTAKNETTQSYGKSPVDNPIWKSPELLVQETARTEQSGKIYDERRAQATAEREMLDHEGLTGPEREAREAEIVKVLNATRDMRLEQLPDTVATQKADTWSAGITAYKLFHGEYPFDAGFNTEIADKIMNYAAGKPGTELFAMGVDSQGQSTGQPVTSLDRLLSAMLHPDPTQRPTITDLLRHGIFAEPNVGSDEAYALIKELSEKTPDPAKLKELSSQLSIS